MFRRIVMVAVVLCCVSWSRAALPYPGEDSDGSTAAIIAFYGNVLALPICSIPLPVNAYRAHTKKPSPGWGTTGVVLGAVQTLTGWALVANIDHPVTHALGAANGALGLANITYGIIGIVNAHKRRMPIAPGATRGNAMHPGISFRAEF